MKPAEIRFSLQRLLPHRDPTMAPTIAAPMTTSTDHLTLTHKLRKLLVEKLRREQINTCIEQLKSLLGPEFLKQQPDSKPEKADILEMTVYFLRRLQQQRKLSVQEVAHVLSKDEVNTLSHGRLMNHINKLQNSSDNLREADISPLSYTVQTTITKDKTRVNSSLWRPW
ncbi:hypothetical protein ACER0C_019655 [Sarotherodon galilaeus]